MDCNSVHVCVCVFGGGVVTKKCGECVCQCEGLRGVCLRLFCGAF